MPRAKFGVVAKVRGTLKKGVKQVLNRYMDGAVFSIVFDWFRRAVLNMHVCGMQALRVARLVSPFSLNSIRTFFSPRPSCFTAAIYYNISRGRPTFPAGEKGTLSGCADFLV